VSYMMLMMIRDKENKKVGVIPDTESVAGYDRAQHPVTLDDRFQKAGIIEAVEFDTLR